MTNNLKSFHYWTWCGSRGNKRQNGLRSLGTDLLWWIWREKKEEDTG